MISNLMDIKNKVLVFSSEVDVMGRVHPICDILNLAERCAGARQIALSTLSRRATGSSTWLERCATGNVTIQSVMRLAPSGLIASPGALCPALGLNRSVYYAVLRRYRDEIGAGRWPRSGSDSERMLIALSTSGDVRFASRRARPAA